MIMEKSLHNSLNNSKIVTSNQTGVHDDLLLILKRYSTQEYKRPIAEFSRTTFKELLLWIQSFKNKSLVLDMGCGTGESSYQLARCYPDCLVIGIDKSISRIERNNEFKNSLPVNVKIVRGELLDLWYLFYQASVKNEVTVHKQYILFPNPWPKKKLIKRRFHANPIFPFILSLSSKIELRTNWKIYAQEFASACEFFGLENVICSDYIPDQAVSNFELKYLESNHDLYKVETNELNDGR